MLNVCLLCVSEPLILFGHMLSQRVSILSFIRLFKIVVTFVGRSQFVNKDDPLLFFLCFIFCI